MKTTLYIVIIKLLEYLDFEKFLNFEIFSVISEKIWMLRCYHKAIVIYEILKFVSWLL